MSGNRPGYRGQTTGTAYQAELRGLRDRLAAAQAEIDYMRDMLLGELQFPHSWKLTGKEAQLLSFMLRVPVATKDAIYAAMYQLDRGGKDVEIKIVDVFICKLRAKMPPECEIITVWGSGYKIPNKEWALNEIAGCNKERRELEAQLDKVRADARRPFELVEKN